jgi:DNA/RNA-binding domain of Phe-tRNA-synthetase-like protein
MIFEVFRDIFKHFPELNIGVIIVKGLDNSKKHKHLTSLFKGVIDYVKLTYTPEEEISPKLIPKHLAKSPLISVWRAAYEEYGAKVHYHTNIERLMTETLAGNTPQSKNSLVDIASYVSLKDLVPVSAYDLDKIEGDIYLGLSEGRDKFTPADSNRAEFIGSNEIIYFSSSIMCRMWGWKESKKTQPTAKTRNAIIFINSLPPTTKAKLNKVMKETAELVKMACGGKASWKLINRKQPKISL